MKKTIFALTLLALMACGTHNQTPADSSRVADSTLSHDSAAVDSARSYSYQLEAKMAFYERRKAERRVGRADYRAMPRTERRSAGPERRSNPGPDRRVRNDRVG